MSVYVFAFIVVVAAFLGVYLSELSVAVLACVLCVHFSVCMCVFAGVGTFL